MNCLRAIALFAVLGSVGCLPSPRAASLAADDAQEFEVARIILERNATDDDAEIVVTVKGQDEGLEHLRVLTPSGVALLDISSGSGSLGVRELAVESPEPGIDRVLAAYPEGRYRIEGTTLSGIRLAGSAKLSHRLPAPPEIRVDLEKMTLAWSAVKGAVAYVLELEREEEDMDVATFTMNLPATATSIRIPEGFRSPGEYQAGVAVVADNGNVTVAEKTFSIGD